jgi:hypothetical protein
MDGKYFIITDRSGTDRRGICVRLAERRLR